MAGQPISAVVEPGGRSDPGRRRRRPGSRSARRPCAGCRRSGTARAPLAARDGSQPADQDRVAADDVERHRVTIAASRVRGTRRPGAAASASMTSCRRDVVGSVRMWSATEWPVWTGTRTAVAATSRSGSSRILRSSAHDLALLAAPALVVEDVDLRHHVVGDPAVERRPVRRLRVPPAARSASKASSPARPAPLTAWYDARSTDSRPARSRIGASATTAAAVVQFGLATRLPARRPMAWPFASGTTSGTLPGRGGRRSSCPRPAAPPGRVPRRSAARSRHRWPGTGRPARLPRRRPARSTGHRSVAVGDRAASEPKARSAAGRQAGIGQDGEEDAADHAAGAGHADHRPVAHDGLRSGANEDRPLAGEQPGEVGVGGADARRPAGARARDSGRRLRHAAAPPAGIRCRTRAAIGSSAPSAIGSHPHAPLDRPRPRGAGSPLARRGCRRYRAWRPRCSGSQRPHATEARMAIFWAASRPATSKEGSGFGVARRLGLGQGVVVGAAVAHGRQDEGGRRVQQPAQRASMPPAAARCSDRLDHGRSATDAGRAQQRGAVLLRQLGQLTAVRGQQCLVAGDVGAARAAGWRGPTPSGSSIPPASSTTASGSSSASSSATDPAHARRERHAPARDAGSRTADPASSDGQRPARDQRARGRRPWSPSR